MEPSIKFNNEILVSSIPYFFNEPKVGDIVAFKFKNQVFIKRISKTNTDKYFLIGDNKKDSLDSKKIGWIDKNKILGKLVCVLTC